MPPQLLTIVTIIRMVSKGPRPAAEGALDENTSSCRDNRCIHHGLADGGADIQISLPNAALTGSDRITLCGVDNARLLEPGTCGVVVQNGSSRAAYWTIGMSLGAARPVRR